MAKPHMFSKLLDFSYKRTKLQAFGFYLAQLIIFLLLSGVVVGFLIGGHMLGSDFAQQERTAKLIGPALGLAHALAMTVFMIRAKHLEQSRTPVLIGALAVLLGGVGGPLVSLIAIACLSTRPAAPTPAQG